MYRAPVDEIAFTLKNVCGLRDLQNTTRHAELGDDLVDAIVNEAGRFAAEEIAPLTADAAKHGTPLKAGAVSTPPGWREAYHAWIEGGWNGLAADVESGGQGLPQMLSAAAMEMWNSGSMAFAIGPTLTIGAVEAMEKHASEDLKATYLDKLVSGEWMGTMNLTEPQAGSDLNALRAKAERNDDGSFRIFGQKIYITYGDHDLTDNIVHMVLARLPDAPAGTRGISMFLVPKFLVNADGSLGERNDVRVAGVEHKLGIHGSPTCTMAYGDESGAIGWLVGEENKGLACMFTMMNNARIMVAIQGTAVAEAATQKALAYANERRQGKAEGFDGEGMAPIIHHPDVQRNIATMRALTNASRAIAYNCAHAIARSAELQHASAGDGGEATPDLPFWQNRAALLTPVAKAFATDIGCEVASLGVQVHGGMGYVEETGAAQLLRDARIAPIYEGTNGIQAIDLVTRKLPIEGGDHVRGYIAELREMVEEVRGSNRVDLDGVADALMAGLDDMTAATDWLLDRMAAGEKSAALSGATPYLRLFALASGATYLAASAVRSADADIEERAAIARFAALDLLTTTTSLRRSIEGGSAALLAAGNFLKSA